MEELTRIRTDRGWSQQQLADESGVNKATINQIERGRRSPNIETLTKLAAALSVEVADFFPKAQAPLPLNFQTPVGRGTAHHRTDAAGKRDVAELELFRRARELREGIEEYERVYGDHSGIVAKVAEEFGDYPGIVAKVTAEIEEMRDEDTRKGEAS
jgi:transcriptional regulator with XRE-family HTH domain